MKYKKNQVPGDADIIACCDGRLVFAECKSLAGVSDDSPVWDTVFSQFLELSQIAVDCRAAVIVLAAQVAKFPSRICERVDSELRPRIPCLLLNEEDLRTGHRRSEQGGWLFIDTFDQPEFVETRIEREGGSRTIQFGAVTYTTG